MTGEGVAAARAPVARRGGVMRALLRLPTGRIGVTGAAVLLVVAIVGPPLLGHDARTLDVLAQSEAPSAAHPFGTDQLGRDILSRTLAATRTSLALAFLAGLIGVAGGTLVGSLAALSGRGPRRVVMRGIDLLLAFPALLIAIFVSSIAGPGGTKAALAIGVALIPQFARLCAGLLLAEGGADHVLAARAAGIRGLIVVRRYMLPGVAGPLAQIACTYVAIALVAVSSLSFLGLGVQPPGFDWGRMLNEGLQNIYITPFAVVPPGVAIVLSGIVLALLGDGLARAVDPRLWSDGEAGEQASMELEDERDDLEPRGSLRQEGDTSATVPPIAGPRQLARQSPPAVTDAAVSVEGLEVVFPTRAGVARCVRDVSFAIRPGEMVGIVGESGSGKSLTVAALAGIVPAPGIVRARRLDVLGVEPLAGSERETRAALASRLAMVFQDPTTSLNPVLTVGFQLTETLRVQAGVPRGKAHAIAAARLADVGIGDPQRVLRSRPYELSGGMRQRVMIAMGLSIQPDLLLADEPTTALDLTTQAQIVALLRDINQSREVPVLLISHDLQLVASVCDRVLVMYGGRILEELPAAALPGGAMQPYTRALLAAEPGIADGELPEGIAGDPPDPANDAPVGCPFAARCPLVMDVCYERMPPRTAAGPDRAFACWAVADRRGQKSGVGAS